MSAAAPKYRAFRRQDLDRLPQLERLTADERLALETVSAVLPFRVSNYVVDELIDWDDLANDPIYQMTFPQRGMLAPADFERMANLVVSGAPVELREQAAREIQLGLNPHPSGQREHNVPHLHGRPLPGLQHKYRETVLFFPQQGQTCHAYCTYCFRWAQFIGDADLTFASDETGPLCEYLGLHPDVSDVLITGGDPLVMRSKVLARYLEPLLDPALAHVQSIRIGTKALAFWPYRFLSDSDSDELLGLFERVCKSGRQLALMAHVSHPRELETDAARRAVRRIRDTGAVIRCQAPLIRHVNDDAAAWAALWRAEAALGMVPYYMFVERDTGPKGYFEVPLVRAHEIFRDAYSQVSGIGRTVRGPSMSATPGKVVVDGIAEIHGEKAFVLRFIQARRAEWVGRPFFAAFDDQATWLDQLRPAFGESSFFFDEGGTCDRALPMRSRRGLAVVGEPAVACP